MIPLADLHESPLNPRQFYPEQAMAELTESIRQDGFREWLPIVVRLRAEGGYEIAAGHRRSRAAAAAGLTEVPCLLRPMGDAEFLDVLNFDNSGREDVHPLHEAAGWRVWMEKTGRGVLDIAAKIGQSKEYVYQRLKYVELIEPAREAFLEGKITAGHAILIARRAPKEQEKALKRCEPPKWAPASRVSVRDLAQFIQEEFHLEMDQVPFDLSDESLIPEAGPCTTCAKRTINAPELVQITYDPIDEEEAADLEKERAEIDECTDPTCFAMKRDASIAHAKTHLAESGKAAVVVSAFYQKTGKGVLNADQYSIVTGKDAKGATSAFMVDGRDAGKVVQVKLKPKPAAGAKQDNWQERQRKEKEQRDRKVSREMPIRLRILEEIGKKVAGARRPDLEALVLFAVGELRGNGGAALCRLHGIEIKPGQEHRADDLLAAAVPAMSESDLFRLVVEIPVAEELNEWSIGNGHPAKGITALAQRYKVDAVKIRTEMEKAQKEAEGGTQREVGKPTKPAPAKKASGGSRKPKPKPPASKKPARSPKAKKK